MDIIKKTPVANGFFVITLRNPDADVVDREFVVALWDGRSKGWESGNYDLDLNRASKRHRELVRTWK